MSTDSMEFFETFITDWLVKATKGETLLPEMTVEKAKESYHMAYHLYRDQQYAEATHFFRYLTMAYPLEAKYWKGLGACLQMQHNYEEALNCYICTQTLNQDQLDSYLYVYAADCYFALKQIPKGLKALKAARLSAEEVQDKRVLNHVALMEELWSKQA